MMGEEEEEDYYEDDAYYDDSAEMMESAKSNLDGAYEDEEEFNAE